MSPSSTSPFQRHHPLISHKVLNNQVWGYEYVMSEKHTSHTAELGVFPMAMAESLPSSLTGY